MADDYERLTDKIELGYEEALALKEGGGGRRFALLPHAGMYARR
jgi:hypothetical protein